MAEHAMKGTRIAARSRAPKVVTGDRVCAYESCTTKLSRYNKRDHCATHAPIRFPRLRGRIVPES